MPKLFVLFFAGFAMAPVGFAQQEKANQKNEKPKVSAQEITNKGKSKLGDAKGAAKREDCGVYKDIEMKDICGKTVKLSDYKGKVVVIVNVASKCGFTGQYRPLQAVYEEFNDQGLEVIAFPCNQFGKQEPGDDEQISTFCKKRFGIAFDIFSKVDVKGEKQAKLFKRLTSMQLEPAGKGDIRWNFEKFIIGKDGKPLARFRSDVPPNSDAIVKKLKQALKANVPESVTEKKSVDKVNDKPKQSKSTSIEKRPGKSKNDA